MTAIAKIVRDLGGGSEVGRMLGVRPQQVSNMRARNSIPVRYWPALIAGARARGVVIDAEHLMHAHAEKRRA